MLHVDIKAVETRGLGDARDLDAATMVVVQFESAAAIDNADAIMAVDGVDMVLIGTNDLLADYGLPGQYDHPRVHEAYSKTLAACQKHGKHLAVGGFASRADLAAKYVRLGARYVSTGTDLGFLLAACTAKAKEVQTWRRNDGSGGLV